MSDGYDWSRKRGDRHPAMATVLRRRKIDPITGNVTFELADLTNASVVNSILQCTKRFDNGIIPSVLVDAIATTDAVNGGTQYNLSVGFAALPSGEYNQEFEVKYNDGTRETFPSDPAAPYKRGVILQDLADG